MKIKIFVNIWVMRQKKKFQIIFLGDLRKKCYSNISKSTYKNMKKIVITGGCGFIGSHIVEYFFNKYKNSKIIVLDKITYAASLQNLQQIKKSKRLKVIIKDILNFSNLKKVTKNCDLMIHAAAESHVDNSYQLNDEFIKTNVLGTKNVMQACKENNVKENYTLALMKYMGKYLKEVFMKKISLIPLILTQAPKLLQK